MTPAELVAFMNEYLSAMTDIIESKGGYVDKYIGDSIVAVFGAPADDSDHASNAAHAALGCRTGLTNSIETPLPSRATRSRTGWAQFGGGTGRQYRSKRRFNYSVMSDAVNVACGSRANKYYGTRSPPRK